MKSVDLHPTEPLLLTTLYNGTIFIWNYAKEVWLILCFIWYLYYVNISQKELYKSIEVNDNPLRCCKWIPNKNWIVVGSDDAFLRIYNVHTGEMIKKWEAHQDYVRALAVHPSKLLILSSSDDFSIKVYWLFYAFYYYYYLFYII